MNVPEQWPAAVAEKYKPLRYLGRGGFAYVTLAELKHNKEAASSRHKQVAIKVVGGFDNEERSEAYAHREIDILRELEHPHIMQLIDFWDRAPDAPTSTAGVMALSYHAGHTVRSLIDYGGALSLVFSRVICAQLVDAVAYLHSRAVIHRDIKPDNMIVTGAKYSQNDIWDDFESSDWTDLRKKWHLTLVDFGFARALTPEDMKKPTPKVTEPPKSFKGANNALDASHHSDNSLRRSFNRSYSRRFQRQMSALGHRSYAAPEVQKNVQEFQLSKHASMDITKTLSKFRSEYGMTADAYSLGSTLKFMITGVPPEENIDQYIADQNSFMATLCRLLCGGGGSSSKDDGQGAARRPKYRGVGQIPKEVVRLIKGMTHYNPQERTSVRTARMYPWIDEALPGIEAYSTSKVDYLSFALKQDADDEAE